MNSQALALRTRTCVSRECDRSQSLRTGTQALIATVQYRSYHSLYFRSSDFMQMIISIPDDRKQPEERHGRCRQKGQ